MNFLSLSGIRACSFGKKNKKGKAKWEYSKQQKTLYVFIDILF